MTTPPATCTGRIVSESRTTANTEPRNGCRFAYIDARAVPTRSITSSQTRFVNAYASTDEKSRHAQTSGVTSPQSSRASAGEATARNGMQQAIETIALTRVDE